ncbi:MAG TPA: uracil-DNA glycosylase [Oligoflexia bacterium]|nr:uracil-DNA glycosylase [Oligoflexia bacterium]HMR24126.1 uracil-DNA glycosylase [Oligoflexia bacterium]
MAIELEYIESFLKDIKRRGQNHLMLELDKTKNHQSSNKSTPTIKNKTVASNKETSAKEVKTLENVYQELGNCQRCQLHSTRKNIVFGVGNKNADLMIVGEAPGRDEDIKGEPFVGRAGQLLTKIIEAIGLSREEIYIANIIKCRPPENRNPEPEEIEQCEPFLIKQIQSIQPKVICCVGKFAAHTLLKTETPISKLRGQFAEYEGIALMPTYHPAYLLRNPSAKKYVWEDMQLVHAKLSQLTGKTFKLKKT